MFNGSKCWYYYNDDLSNWYFEQIELFEESIKSAIGIAFHNVKNIHKWDTAYINVIKERLGNDVLDGYSFWANKVIMDGNRVNVFNYTFYELP